MRITLHYLGSALLAVALLMWHNPATAANFDASSLSDTADCSADCATTTTCCDTCCRAVCFPKTEQVDEKKTCRIVKCEKVAVPAITLPWEQGGSPFTLFNCLRHLTQPQASKCQCGECSAAVDCCDTCGCEECSLCGPTRCGTVRLVSVLDKEKNDVKKCETTWEIGCVPACGHCPHCRK